MMCWLVLKIRYVNDSDQKISDPDQILVKWLSAFLIRLWDYGQAMAMYGELVGEDLVFDPNPVEISEHGMALDKLKPRRINQEEELRKTEDNRIRRRVKRNQHQRRQIESQISVRCWGKPGAWEGTGLGSRSFSYRTKHRGLCVSRCVDARLAHFAGFRCCEVHSIESASSCL